jgi:hypothetical protein
MRLAVLIIGALAALLTAWDASADVSIAQDGPGPSEILIRSEVRAGDFAAFQSAADHLARTTRAKLHDVPFIQVALDSPGGDVLEAMRIGRVVHERFMLTKVLRECSSACVLILAAGATRIVGDHAHLGLHRPAFDSINFANLSSDQARKKYNAMIESVRRYFDEIGADREVLHLMLQTPSSDVHSLTDAEIDRLSLRGSDPAWAEHGDALGSQMYGAERWQIKKRCIERAKNWDDVHACD